MPGSSSVGPVNIFINLTEGVQGMYEFYYKEDPVVETVVRAATIVRLDYGHY